MSHTENPRGEAPIGNGRRPVAHYVGMAVTVVVLVVIVAALFR